MRDGMSRVNIHIYQDLEALSKAVADQFTDIVVEAAKQYGRFTVALTGGNTVKDLYELLAFPPYIGKIDWAKGRFFWGDERMVPPDHPESNYGECHHLLLHHVGVKSENIYRIRGELEPLQAVEDYQKRLRENAFEGLVWPRFDLVLLGMGSDGHIASIFPGDSLGTEEDAAVIFTNAEYDGRPALRVSLTPLVFNSAKEIMFLVSGKNKAAILEKVLRGDGDPENYPALRIHPDNGEVTWFVDEEAASLLPKMYFDSR
jgi:6-phosphogluconolactonase